MRIRLSVATLCLLLAAVAARAAPASPISEPNAPAHWVLCFENRDVPPWRYADGSGDNITLLDGAATRAGVRFSYVARPFLRCKSDIAAGRVDGLFAISHSKAREALWAYPPAAARREHRMFVDGYVLLRRRGDSVRVEGGRIVGLNGRVGAQPGYSIVDRLRAQGLNVDDGSPDAPLVLRKLADRRIGAAAIGISTVNSIKAETPTLMAHFEILPEPLVKQDYFLVLSKKRLQQDPGLSQKIWEAIRAERESHEAATTID